MGDKESKVKQSSTAKTTRRDFIKTSAIAAGAAAASMAIPKISAAAETKKVDPGARPRDGEREHDQRKEGKKAKHELAAGDISDKDEEANLGDPDEKANIDDPNEKANMGDPDEKSDIDDPDEKKNIGDPEEKKDFEQE